MSILIEHTPIMSSNTSDDVIISASGNYDKDYPYKGLYHFTGYDSDPRPWWYYAASTFPIFWKLEFVNDLKCINKISLSNLLVTSLYFSLKNFNLYGSLNDIDYTKLLEVKDFPNSSKNMTYIFNNYKKYKYYKFDNLEGYFGGGYYIAFHELRLFEEINNIYLLKSEDKYYSIKEENYDEQNQEYIPSLINSLSINNFENYGMSDLSLINSNNIDNFIDEKFNVNLLK